MNVAIDVKCYHCGHLTGEFVGDSTVPLAQRTFKPSDQCKEAIQGGERIRCCRCGGPVFLDDIRPIRTYPVWDPKLHPARPGRPRKHPRPEEKKEEDMASSGSVL